MFDSRYKQLWRGVSPFGDRIEVVERGAVVQLRINEVWQGELDRRSPLMLPTPYMQQMLLALCYTGALRRFLVIGLGTGCLPKALRAVLPRARVDVVEIDSLIVGLAKRFFEVIPDNNENTRGPGLYIYVQDGVDFLAQTQTTYDAIFVDAFSGGELPEAFRSRRTIYHLRNRLAPGGVLAFNLSRLDVYAIKEVSAHIGALISPPAAFDPKNEERHDDLNLVLMAPTPHNAKRMRERRLFLESHGLHLGMDIDRLLANRLSAPDLNKVTDLRYPLFSLSRRIWPDRCVKIIP